MKKILIIALLPLSLISRAQLYTPNQTISATGNAATGNIGIGTSTPNAKLEVAGVGRFTSSGGFSIGPDANQLRIQTSPEMPYQAFGFLNANNSFEGIRVRQISVGASFADTSPAPANGMIIEGNVGIGTTVPSNDNEWNRVLDVRGVRHAKILVTAQNADYKTGIFTHDASWYGGGGFIGTESNHKLHFITNYDPKMTLDTHGNLGIGTTSPDGKLKIYNASAFNPNDAANGQDHIILNAVDPGNGGYFGGITWESGSRRRASIVATREKDDKDYVGLAFFTQGTDGPGPMSESMRITRNGSVGIGTTSPDSKLTVKGDIHTREVRVDMAGSVAGDYVFEKDYDLLSLPKLETYINENKHLPEVPSAKEMEANGLNLKEMNLILLKKVEELTLHLIGQQKEIEEIKSVNRSLEQRIKRTNKNHR